MTTVLSFVAIGAAAAVPAVAFVLGGRWILALPIVALGALWSVGRWRGWSWTAPLGLACLVGASAGGLALGLEIGWMLAGTVVALSAWDLDRFARELASVQRVEERSRLEWGHLLRLLLVNGLALVLVGVALVVRLEFRFAWVFLLGILAVLGLGQLIALFRKAGQ